MTLNDLNDLKNSYKLITGLELLKKDPLRVNSVWLKNVLVEKLD